MSDKKQIIDHDLIRELASLLTETDLSEIEVEQGETRIRVARNSGSAAAPAPVAVAPSSHASAPSVSLGSAGDDPSTHPGTVTSPMVGTAYFSPEPGARPFVDVGQGDGTVFVGPSGEVILFADQVTDSIESLLKITEYRRRKQIEYNTEHDITPQSVKRSIQESLQSVLKGRELNASLVREDGGDFDVTEVIRELETEMEQAAASLEYERAALLRDQIKELKGPGEASASRRQRVKYQGKR